MKKRTRTSTKKTCLAAAFATALACAPPRAVLVLASSSGFPGTIQPVSPSYAKTKGQSSEDPHGDGDGDDSSSDWDDALIMEEDPLAFVDHSLSGDESVEANSENDGGEINKAALLTEKSSASSVVSPPSPPLNQQQQQQFDDSSKDSTTKDTNKNQALKDTNPLAQEQTKQNSSGRGSTTTAAAVQPLSASNSNANTPKIRHHGRPSNQKPLKTLQKLQQLLDDTDYLTSSSGPATVGTTDPPQAATTTSSSASSSSSIVSGIDSLWTSKDRTKYKKQQRLQKEQIRLKHQQEEQLPRQQQSLATTTTEAEDLSDTDDGLGYTLPNLPIYLSDGEDDTDEAYLLPSVSPPKQQPQKKYSQQERDLFLQRQGDPQQQPPPPPPLHQHPYYPGGAYPPPPPPPPGYYPYPPPPPGYYNGGPMHQYAQHMSSYFPYPTSGLPRIETTVPRNNNRSQWQMQSRTTAETSDQQYRYQSTDDSKEPNISSSSESPQTFSPVDNKTTDVTGKGTNAGQQANAAVYPFYPQSPEQQEQWHKQQLQLLQSQEQYRKQLQRHHNRLVFVNHLKNLLATTRKTIDATFQLGVCVATVGILCYAAVSPRNLSYLEYNQMAYNNLKLVSLVVIPPLIGHSWLIVDWEQVGRMVLGYPSGDKNNSEATSSANDAAAEHTQTIEWTSRPFVASAIHALIHSLYCSFLFGYLWIFVLEIAWTTILRLAVFLAWEPDMFGVKLPWSGGEPSPSSSFSSTMASESMAIPSLWILPWVLREYKYRPKRITVLVADILTSCVACPIIEEFVKLRLLQWTMPLSKNFSWVLKSTKHYPKKQKTKWVAEPIQASNDKEHEDMVEKSARGKLDGMVTNINPYIAGMLAVSLGIKWADSIRRVCMYTKAQDEQKSVYAFLRGLFPVQELCGIMTALRLARRDVLGQKMPLWNLLLPSVIVHSMANLRGMKPVFKWNSSTPWAEMQLSPDLFPGLFSERTLEEFGGGITIPQTKLQWFGRAFPKIMWAVILFRVTGYCVKNYFMINRQAIKRATMYAGKHAAFSAELETAAKLKNAKDK